MPAAPPGEAAQTTLAGVPALVRRPAQVSKSPLLLWHGFGPPDGERELMQALPLDDVPALKIYLGLPLFGARAPAGGMAEVVRRQNQDLATLVFEPVVMGAALELPKVVAALREAGCLEPGAGIGLFGFSAGGAATLFALAEADVPIRAALILNASTGLSASVAAYEKATGRTYAWTDTARAIARRSDAIGRAADIASAHPPPALLILHGAADAMLGPDRASSLYEALLPHYRVAGSEARLRLELVADMAHGWTDASHLERVRAAVAGWFAREL